MATLKVLYGTAGNLPNTTVQGRLFFCTDTKHIYFDIDTSSTVSASTRIQLYGNDINQIISAYSTANSAYSRANTAYTAANNAANTASNAYTAANTAKTAADTANSTANSAKTSITSLQNTVGTPTSGKTVVGMISDVSSKVTTNTNAIATLNGGKTVAGSVDKKVADAIAAVVANAPASFDTLKEISDWITNDTTGAAKMANDISALQTTTSNLSSNLSTANSSITTLTNKVNTLNGGSTTTGSVAKTVADAINALDVSDTAQSGKYVSAVSETNGKISVTRASLPAIEIAWQTF